MVHLPPELWGKGYKEMSHVAGRDIPRATCELLGLWGCQCVPWVGDAEMDEQALPWTFPRGNTVMSRSLLSWGLWTQPRLWRSCAVFVVMTRSWAPRSASRRLCSAIRLLCSWWFSTEGQHQLLLLTHFGSKREFMLTELTWECPVRRNAWCENAILTWACLGVRGFGGGFIHSLIAQHTLSSVGSTGNPWDCEGFSSLLVIILD